MPQPRFLHQAHEGTPYSKQSAPCVPLPAPGGQPRCGAASGTLRACARGGLRACGRGCDPPSRGRGKQSIRKRSLSDGRMREGACKRRTHESRQCVHRRVSCSITSRRAAKYKRPNVPRKCAPRGGAPSGSARAGPHSAPCPPPDSVPPSPSPCTEFGPVPPPVGTCPATNGPGRLGAPAPHTPHNPGPDQPRRPLPTLGSKQAPGPTGPGHG